MGQRYDFFLNRPTFFKEKGSPSLISKKEEPVYVLFLAKILPPEKGWLPIWLCLIDRSSYFLFALQNYEKLLRQDWFKLVHF